MANQPVAKIVERWARELPKMHELDYQTRAGMVAANKRATEALHALLIRLQSPKGGLPEPCLPRERQSCGTSAFGASANARYGGGPNRLRPSVPFKNPSSTTPHQNKMPPRMSNVVTTVS
jgi:hypothetical protein